MRVGPVCRVTVPIAVLNPLPTFKGLLVALPLLLLVAMALNVVDEFSEAAGFFLSVVLFLALLVWLYISGGRK